MKLKKISYLLFIIATICLITSCNKECKHQSTYWEIDKQATCTQNGSRHKECTICHEKLVTEVIEALGHDLVHHEKQNPTCTKKGYEAYDACARCSYTTYEELPATGHTESEWIIDVDATCTENGSKHKECTKCYEKLDTEVIESLGHDLVHHEKEDPTCTETGHKVYDTCTRCSYTTYEELPATGHIESNWIIDKQATCTAIGNIHKECTICHKKLVTEVIESLGHDLVHHEKEEPTCTETGYEAYDTCSRCDYTTYEEIPAIGHDLVHHEKKDPTCTEKGYKEYYSCTRCSYTTYEEIPELGHIYEDGICTRCGYELTSSDLLYELTSDNTGYIVTGLDYSKYDINALTIIIPSEYKGLPIVGIKEEAFKNKINLKKIILSNNITYVEKYAFGYCTSLTSIEIPNSLTSIGNTAFEGCNLKNVYYNGTIEDWCNISFKSNLMEYAGHFYMLDENNEYKEVTEIVIPETITKIGDYQFFGFDNITSITIPSSITYIGAFAFRCACLTSIEIPDSVASIGFGSFIGCTSLTNIVIPNSVTSIGEYAFRGCTSLTSIVIPNSVSSMGESVFSGCTSLTSIEIPNSVATIGDFAFENCTSLTNIVIPNSVTSIGEYAFRGCTSLTSIIIPDSVTSIGIDAFEGCNLKNVYYKGTIEDWCNISFSSYYSTPMTYSNHFYMLDENKEYKEVTEIAIPETITKIGDYQFCGFCFYNIKNITIPNSVTSIGSVAFGEFNFLTNVYYNGTIEDWCNISFNSYNLNPMYYASHFYMLDENKEYKEVTEIAIPETVTRIGNYQFWGLRNIKKITIPNSVTSIGKEAFTGWTDLTIYCEAPKKPSGWNDNWNSSDCNVVWGYKKD